jgi:O-antigen/teichoic acid export membrane protein
MFEKLKLLLSKDHFFSRIIAVLVVRGLGILASYFFSIYVAKKFGAETLGMFSLATTIVLFLVFFSKRGFDTAFLRLVSECASTNRKDLISIFYKIGIRMVLPISIIISIVYFLLSKEIATIAFHKPEMTTYLLVSSMLILPNVFIMIHSEGLRGEGNVAVSAFLQNLSIFLFSLAFLFLFQHFFSSTKLNEAPIWAYFGGQFATLLLSIYFWRRNLNFKTNIQLPKEYSNSVSNISGPMFWIGAMVVVLGCSDNLLLGILSNEKNVGIYSMAIKISVGLSVPIMAANTVVAPRFTKFYLEGDTIGLEKLAINVSKIVFVLCFPVFILIMIFSDEIMKLFGNEFIIGSETLVILSIAQLVNISFGSSDTLLLMTGNEKLFRNIIVFAAILNLILNIIFIPLFGIKGAAFANMFSLISLNVLSAYWINKRLKIKVSILHEITSKIFNYVFCK